MLLMLMYFKLFIIDYLGYGSIMNIILGVLIILFSLREIMSNKFDKGLLIQLVLIFVLEMISFLCGTGNSINIFRINFNLMLYPMLFAIYIFLLAKNYPQLLKKFYTNNWALFNITMLINLVIMKFQIDNPYSFVARGLNMDDIVGLSYWGDNASGLFAAYGTHIVCIFTTFIIIYDINIIRDKCTKHSKRIATKILLATIIIFSLIIASQNDNKALYFYLPLTLLLYLFLGRSTSNKITKIIFGITIFLLVFFIAYFASNTLRNIVEKTIIAPIMENFVKALNTTGQVAGSGQRFSQINYAMKKYSTWLLGVGIGKTEYYHSNFMGFMAFGQSDLGTLLILCGIWFVITLISIYIRIYFSVINMLKINTNKFFNICLLIYIIITMIYTNIFVGNSSLQFTLLLLMITFAFK